MLSIRAIGRRVLYMLTVKALARLQGCAGYTFLISFSLDAWFCNTYVCRYLLSMYWHMRANFYSYETFK